MKLTPKVAKSVGSSAISVLLGLGFLISCGLLMKHLWSAPAFDYAIVGELLLVAVLSLEGIVAVNHLRQSQLDSLHLLLEVFNDYRSAEMMLALVTLWRFRRQHGDQFVQVYLETWHRDEEQIAQRPAEEQVEAMGASLHYRQPSR